MVLLLYDDYKRRHYSGFYSYTCCFVTLIYIFILLTPFLLARYSEGILIISFRFLGLSLIIF